MKKNIIRFFPFLLALLAFSACRQNDGSPIRNVRFDPNLLNQVRAGSSCATYTYTDGAVQQSLGPVYTKQVLVAFARNLSYQDQQRAVEEYGFLQGLQGQAGGASTILYTLTFVDGLNCQQVEQALVELAKDERFVYVAPYFLQGNTLLGLSNEVVVKLAANKKDALTPVLEAYGAVLVSALGDNSYLVKVDKNARGNALELANHLQGQRGIVAAVPKLLHSAVSLERAHGKNFKLQKSGV